MGIGSFLFGGTKVKDINTPEIKDLAGQLGNFDPGLGPAGRYLKGQLNKKLAQGKYDELSQVMAVKARGATDLRELLRNLQMNYNAMGGQNPEQYAGLLMKGRLQNQDQTGVQSLMAAANQERDILSGLDEAFGRRVGMEYAGKRDAAEILQRGRQLTQTKGLFGALGELSSLFNPFAAAFNRGGATAGGGGVGSLHSGSIGASRAYGGY